VHAADTLAGAQHFLPRGHIDRAILSYTSICRDVACVVKSVANKVCLHSGQRIAEDDAVDVGIKDRLLVSGGASLSEEARNAVPM